MDMNAINIKVDPGSSIATLKVFNDNLAATETRGKVLTQSLSSVAGAFKSVAAALQQEQSALQRTNTLHEQLTTKNSGLVGSFGSLAQAIQREQSMLEKINGPARQYMEDLQALDSLLQKNKISTEQYAAQVTKLNQAQQTGSGGAKGGAAPEASSPIEGIKTLGEVALGGGIAAGVLEIGDKVGELVEEYRRLEDEYTNLINHEMKFVNATHSLGEVMAQQQAISASLHSTLAEGAEVYDAVANAVVDLNLSSTDLVALTKTVGQEAVLSGKSMASAGDLLNRMTLAMDSGADSGRALKQALIGYDAIADTLATHFGTTRAGLVELANQHKITSKDVIEALKAESGEVQASFDKRKVTNEQEKAMLAERVNMYRQQGASHMDAEMMALNSDYAANVEQMRRWTNAQYDQQRSLDEALPKIEQLTKDLQNMSGGFAEVGKAEGQIFAKFADDIVSADTQFNKLGRTITSTLDNIAAHMPGGMKTAMEYAATLGDTKQKILDLQQAYVGGAFGTGKDAAGEFLLRMEQLTSGIKAQKDALVEHHTAVQQESADMLALKRDLDLGVGGQDAARNAEQAARDLTEWAKSMQDDLQKTQDEAVRSHNEQLTKEWHAQIEQVDKAIGAMRDDAKTILDPLKQSFHDIITKGSTDWSAMVDSMASNVTDKLLGRGEDALLQAAFGKTSQEMGLTTSFATGGATAGTEIAASMVGAGATVAALLASAMTGAGIASGAGGLLAGVASGAGAASAGGGTGGILGGAASGGAAAARKGGQSTSPTHVTNVVNMMYDRRAVIDNRDDATRVAKALADNPNLLSGKWR